MILSVKIEGDKELMKLYREMPPVLRKELKRAISNTARVMEGDAKKFSPVDMGRLRSSIRTEMDADGMGAWVGPSLPPIDIVMERGRKPGSRMPPVSALIGWVRRHNMVKYTKGRGGTRVNRNYDRAVYGMAFVIAKSIARKGTRPHRYMGLAADRAELNWNINIRQAFDRAVKQV
jgi:hypothetical protein